MTKLILLDGIKEFCDRVTKDLILPVAPTKEDQNPDPRAMVSYRMRLPNSKAYKKYAPYCIHQIITSNDVQPTGKTNQSTAVIRSVFCVYCENEEEGELHLLNVMERVRISLLKSRIISRQFVLDADAGIDSLTYVTSDTAPYYGGEMITTWKIPAIEREDDLWPLNGPQKPPRKRE